MDILNEIKIQKLSQTAVMPAKQTAYSAGYDIYASAECTIPARGFAAVPTGIAMEMPMNIEAQVRPRSGLAFKYGITVLNAPGTIDADYRGEIRVALVNHSDTDYHINVGDRIAQLVFAAVVPVQLIEVGSIGETERGCGGFGSTGK